MLLVAEPKLEHEGTKWDGLSLLSDLTELHDNCDACLARALASWLML